MKNIYIAGPFFDDGQTRVIEYIENFLSELKAEGANFDFFSPRKAGFVPALTPEEKAKQGPIVFQSNIDNMNRADCLIVVSDWPDKGTMFEMGYAYAKNKIIITYSPHGWKQNLMLQYATACHAKTEEQLGELVVSYVTGEKWLNTVLKYEAIPAPEDIE